ncbi:MAG TPA: hypothetical protein VFM85_05515 [Actinomycetota bacterium]|nr:hypothetical protein [Actinomycetota bacterium]
MLDGIKGYKAYFVANHADIEMVAEVNDWADPSYAPEAYAAAIQNIVQFKHKES